MTHARGDSESTTGASRAFCRAPRPGSPSSRPAQVARRRPADVERIVTLGTPVQGGPEYTSAAGIFARRGLDLDAFEQWVRARNDVTITAPITAIYSRKDAVVAWSACIDPNRDNDVEHVDVDAYHCELGFCPQVLEIVARRLV